MFSDKASYGKQGPNKYYIGYLSDGNNKEFLKYIKIWKKIEDLFYEKFIKRGLYNKPTHNEHISTKICPYNEDFHGNKKLAKDEYYGNSTLLIESIYEVKNK